MRRPQKLKFFPLLLFESEMQHGRKLLIPPFIPVILSYIRHLKEMGSRWMKSLLCFSGHNNIKRSAGFLTSLGAAIAGRSRAHPGKKGLVISLSSLREHRAMKRWSLA